ncbi:MAG: SDR family oxidoreductase [Thermoanaerobaculia bacterium]|jgi:dTDP-4-dehydrorhamnose reductase
MSERLLVVGGTGMLGHRLVLEASPRLETWWTTRGDGGAARNVLPTSRCLARIDVTAPGQLENALDSVRPTVVVNCAGTVKQRADVSAGEMIRANALFPHALADACDAIGARLVHLSTDCVFSGSEGDRPYGYDENAVPDAADLYGRSKLLGEIDRPGHLTIRTSMIGPELSRHTGLLDWFLRASPPVAGYRRARFTGLTTPVLSRLLIRLAIDQPRLVGVYHLAGPAIDKCSLLLMLRNRLRPGVDVRPDETVSIDRRLDGRRLAAAAGIAVPSWPEMIDELAELAPNGKELE